MDNESEVIRQQMDETRASLTEKIETLEHQVVDTVKDTATAVSDTVETVKEAVQESVATVKDSVTDTVETVKESVRETFDLRRHVSRHPWAWMGGAVALGCIGGSLISRAPAAKPGAGGGPTSHEHLAAVSNRRRNLREYEPDGSLTHQNGDGAAAPREESRLGELGKKLSPEIAKLRGLAIGATMGLLRDMCVSAAPPELGDQLKEVMDSITEKIGGIMIEGPILCEKPSTARTEGAANGRQDSYCAGASRA